LQLGNASDEEMKNAPAYRSTGHLVMRNAGSEYLNQFCYDAIEATLQSRACFDQTADRDGIIRRYLVKGEYLPTSVAMSSGYPSAATIR
jgi:hypothetical protein